MATTTAVVCFFFAPVRCRFLFFFSPLPLPHGASNLGDHVLNTVTSINSSRLRFRNAGLGRKRRSRCFFFSLSFSVYLFIYFLRKRHICARMGLSFGGTTFMILSLVLRRRPLSRSLCGKKRGPVYKVAFFPLLFLLLLAV